MGDAGAPRGEEALEVLQIMGTSEGPGERGLRPRCLLHVHIQGTPLRSVGRGGGRGRSQFRCKRPKEGRGPMASKRIRGKVNSGTLTLEDGRG